MKNDWRACGTLGVTTREGGLDPPSNSARSLLIILTNFSSQYCVMQFILDSWSEVLLCFSPLRNSPTFFFPPIAGAGDQRLTFGAHVHMQKMAQKFPSILGQCPSNHLPL